MQKEWVGAAATARIVSGTLTSGATSFTIDASTGWPSGAVNPFVVVINRGTGSEEKVLCASRTGSTIAVTTRGWDGTAAASHANGSTVEHCVDADSIATFDAHVHDTTRNDHEQYIPRDGSAAFTGLALVANTLPTTITRGDAASIGAGVALARSSHKHALGHLPATENFNTSTVSTSSMSYVDLGGVSATATPIGPKTLVVVSATITPSVLGVGDVGGVIALHMTGGNLWSASDTKALYVSGYAGNGSICFVVDTPNLVSTVFGTRFRSTLGDPVSFTNVRVAAIPL